MYRRRANVFSPRKRPPIGRWLLLALAVLVIVVGVYAVFDNGRIQVKTQRVLVPNLPSALEGFTVLHASDLDGRRFGPTQKQIANAVKEKRYHAVCLTGDMVGPNADPYPLLEFLQAVDSTKPVFFIAGDSDPLAVGGQAAGYHTVLANWVLDAQGRGAVFLGAPQAVTVGSATVWFSDASQLSLDLDVALEAYEAAATPISQYYAQVVRDTIAARAQMRDTDLHIALTHKPISASMINTMRSASGEGGEEFVRSVDLILAGSTAGGQWVLPFAGPVWADGWFPEKSAVEGYHYTGGLLQYISGGLGTSAESPLPKFRLFNTPEITLITFTAKMDEGVLPED